MGRCGRDDESVGEDRSSAGPVRGGELTGLKILLDRERDEHRLARGNKSVPSCDDVMFAAVSACQTRTQSTSGWKPAGVLSSIAPVQPPIHCRRARTWLAGGLEHSTGVPGSRSTHAMETAADTTLLCSAVRVAGEHFVLPRSVRSPSCWVAPTRHGLGPLPANGDILRARRP